MKKTIIGSLLLLISTAAVAQQSKTQLLNSLSTYFPSGCSHCITAQTMQTVLSTIVISYMDLSGAPTQSCGTQVVVGWSTLSTPVCGQVSLTAGVVGNLPVTNLNNGTGASALTYWTGNGSWGPVNLTGGSTGTLPSSQLPSPFTNGTASGNTNKFATTTGPAVQGDCVSIDSLGNYVDSGGPCAQASNTLIELTGFSYYLGCNNLISCWVGFNANVFTNILNTQTNTKPVVVTDRLSELNITTGGFTPQNSGVYETRMLMEGTSVTNQTLLSCGWSTSSSGVQPPLAIVQIETQGSNQYNNSHMTPFIVSLVGGTTYYMICWANNTWNFNNLTVQNVPISPAAIIDFIIRRVQ